MRRGLATLAAMLLGGCGVSDVFTCTRDDQCRRGGEEGRCEAAGACSFHDLACAGGWRYGTLSPAGVAGQCVAADAPAPDASVPEPPDAAPSPPDASRPPPDAPASSADAAPPPDAPPPDGPPPDASVLPDAPAPDAARPDAPPPPPPDAAVVPDAPPAPDAPSGTVELVLPVVADTTLRMDQPGNNFGAGPTLTAGGTSVILLRFDATAVGSRTVIGASLHVFTTANGGLTKGSVQVFQLLESWSEGSADGAPGAASWNERSAGTAWMGAGASGGSRDPTVLAQAVPVADATEHVMALPVAVVQGWAQNAATNDGLILVTKDQANRTLGLVAREGAAGNEAFLRVRVAE